MDAIAYLHAVANPDDAVNVRRILNVPKRGLGERTEGTLAWFAERERISFGAAVERYAEVGLPARAEKGLVPAAALLAFRGGAGGPARGQALIEVEDHPARPWRRLGQARLHGIPQAEDQPRPATGQRLRGLVQIPSVVRQ